MQVTVERVTSGQWAEWAVLFDGEEVYRCGGSAHAGATARGARDAIAGIRNCPYPDLRRKCGRITGARGFRNAWYLGHELAQSKREGTVMP